MDPNLFHLDWERVSEVLMQFITDTRWRASSLVAALPARGGLI